jgi:hypothetical protein
MGYFFLPQMDDSFTGGLCFDTPREGEGGAPTPRSPFSKGSAGLALRYRTGGKRKPEVPREQALVCLPRVS